MGKGRLLSKHSNDKSVFQECLSRLQAKQDLGLSCLTNSIDIWHSKSSEPSIDPQYQFLSNIVGPEVVQKLVQKHKMGHQEFIKIALYFSLNRLINMSSDTEVEKYFRNINCVLELLMDLEDEQQIIFLYIFEERLAWEITDFFYHLNEKNLIPRDFALVMKFLFNMSLLFEWKNFQSTRVFRKILNLFNWSDISYLFVVDLKEEESDIILTKSDSFWVTQTILQKEELSQIIELLLNLLTIQLLDDKRFLKLKKEDLEVVKPSCNFLTLIWKMNNYLANQVRLPRSEFVNSFLSDDYEFQKPVMACIKQRILNNKKLKGLHPIIEKIKPPGGFNHLDFPFLLSVERKAEILEFESHLEQKFEISGQNFIASILSGEPMSLNLKVSRNSLLEDTLFQLTSSSTTKNLKKQLRVEFIGEPGMDEGGLTKELFHLVCIELFDPNIGMFCTKNSSFLWINRDSIDCGLNFELIGIVMGLAIYNETLLDLHFPLALYKKLLADCCRASGKIVPLHLRLSLRDFEEIEPEIANSLQKTLEMDLPPDNQIGLTFEIEYTSWGQAKLHELIPNGKNINLENAVAGRKKIM